MHTLTMLGAGFALLGVCLVIGHIADGGTTGMAMAARAFAPLWLAVSIGNLWVGVAVAGYTVGQELPILVTVFAPPALLAGLLIRRWGRG